MRVLSLANNLFTGIGVVYADSLNVHTFGRGFKKSNEKTGSFWNRGRIHADEPSGTTGIRVEWRDPPQTAFDSHREVLRGWYRRYVKFCGSQHPRLLGKEDVERFLTHLAVNAQVAASTQNQALNAILFLYREVLDIHLEGIDAVRAKQLKREPTVLSTEETGRLLAAMQGATGLVAQLLYGCGLRLSEAIRLRIKDTDLESAVVWVRSGKGGKDRSVSMPGRCREQVKAQMAFAKTLFESDRRTGVAGVYLPNAFERKSPAAAESWPWFWLFPSGQLSVDPRGGAQRRHHLHENSVGKALAVAAKQAGLSPSCSRSDG